MPEKAGPGPLPFPEVESGTAIQVGSVRAEAAVGLVGALAKAARAFTLYDPKNAVVRRFIGDYRAKAEAATAGGPVVLEVRPYELSLETEVVYRSLAKTGVRLGQPVRCGERRGLPLSALRLCNSARLIGEALGGRGDAEAIDAGLAVLDRIASIARAVSLASI